MHLIDCVAGAATANVVNGRGVLRQASLLSKFLIEAEHCSFLFTVDVACAAAAGGEESIEWWRTELDAGGRSCGVRTWSDVVRVDASDVACAASASGVVMAGRDGWVWFSDLIRWHLGVFGEVVSERRENR